MPYAILLNEPAQLSMEQLKTAFRALCVVCAVASAVVGGELTAEERRVAEELFLKAMMLPVRAQVQSSLETKEDPLAPDHWLSRVKPPVKPKAIPAPDPHAEPHEFGGTGFGKPFLLVGPLPGHKIKKTEDFRPLMDGEKSSWIIYGPRGITVTALSSGIHMIPLELPEELIAKFRQFDRRMGTDHTRQILQELQRLRRIDKFDLLRLMVGLDARSFGPARPFHLRVVNVMCFGYKYLFVPREGSPFGYYKGENVRCLIWGPHVYVTEEVGEDGKAKEDRTEYFEAEVAVRGCDQVLNIGWTGEQTGAPGVTRKNFLTFLASIRVNAATTPKTERE